MTGEELVIRNWRVTEALPSGLHVFFDPSRECVKLFRLHPDEQPPLNSESGLGPLAVAVDAGYLDRVSSVSADETEAEPVQMTIEDALRQAGEELPF